MIQTLEHIGDIGRFLGKEAECFVVYDPNVAWVAEEVMAALPVKGARSLETSEPACRLSHRNSREATHTY